MCDEFTEEDNQTYLKNVSRRQFAALAGGAGITTVLTGCSDAETDDPAAKAKAPAKKLEVTESNVTVTTADGEADCYFVHPATGQHPGVIIWPDIKSLRPAFRTMGKRLATAGYSVLVINPYYRTHKGEIISEGESFSDPEVRKRLMPHYRALSAETVANDTKAMVAFLDAQPSVDTSRKIGTAGYCMGGPMTMHAAATAPDRIGAGASFHGGGVATDKPDSPHLRVPEMKAGFLFAIAENDDERDPEHKNRLRKAYDDAGLFAEIEVYAGAMHGWCAIDSDVYFEMQAEKAWARMLALFEQELG